MAYSHKSWVPKTRAEEWPESAHEEVTDLGKAVTRWEQTLRERHPQLLGHLVWNSERLRRLEQAAQAIIEQEDWVDSSLVGVYRRSLINRITGLGPLDDLLLDESVNDIMVNGADKVFCDKNGVIAAVDLAFEDDEEVVALAQRLAARAGRTLNTEIPLCDAELADGSRIHCVIAPVSRTPAITIRRSRQQSLSVEACLDAGTFSAELWGDLVRMTRERLNIVVAGGAGSGKTSMLRLLATGIADSERLVVIEDVRELNLTHPNLVCLETTARIHADELVTNALRMRPDRIIVGEVRGPEVLALLEAMATGHPGSLSTVHSRSGGLDTVHRLARIGARGAGGLGFSDLVDQIRSTLEVTVYMTRYPDGRRRVSEVTLVGPASIQKLWQYQPATGEFVRWGNVPC